MPSFRLRRSFALSLILVLAANLRGAAQEKSINPGINKIYENPDAKKFVGQMETEGREAFVHRKEIVAACKLKAGMAIADIGCGTGLFTRLFAAEVGPTGRVYAVDIAASFVEHVAKTCRDAGLNNVTTIVCTADSSKLPENSVDAIYISDTYHHFEFPEKTLATLRRAIRPDGRLIVVDYRRIEGQTPEWLMKHVRAGQDVVTREIEAAGFELVEQGHFLKDNYFLKFAPVAIATTSNDDSHALETDVLRVEVDGKHGSWSLLDKRSGVRWPTRGNAGLGLKAKFEADKHEIEAHDGRIRIQRGDAAVDFRLAGGDTLTIDYEGNDLGEIRSLEDALTVTDAEQGAVIVPCREGLWIPATGGVSFQHVFPTSDYEGCHMNMLGLAKSGAALIASWEDSYVSPELASAASRDAGSKQRIKTTLVLRGTARTIHLSPLGKGDWNTIAAGYRRLAEKKTLAVTLRDKIARNPHEELLVGAANVKLWTCLSRRMNEASTKVESEAVLWTFDEAAQVAEHLRHDVGISRCLFTIGGWTDGGYDCRHPDDLPANKECGGNEELASAVERIQKLGYVACLHDNYQDMYRNAKSWSPDYIAKRPDGSLIQGGRWLGGRAFIVCSEEQVKLAMRPQNMPAIHKLFGPWCCFIDTTYAAGPIECADPKHPIDRNGDILWKIRLSEASRKTFGLFGSECGREWALPHSDFFEGLVGVAGRDFHNLKPETLGAKVIPFWEMVYHDCEICYGKYGYSSESAGPFVAHHLLAARPLYYHSIPPHLYWKQPHASHDSTNPAACYARTDQGWAEGLHPVDAFMKTTYEVLGPLHAATAHDRLTKLEFLTPDGSLRRAVYGEGDAATTVVVNFGPSDATFDSRHGGNVLLPPWGFIIEGPRIEAFYAKSYAGRDYPTGAMFVVRPSGDATLEAAAKIHIFHGFGDPKIDWRGKSHEVRREEEIE